MSTHDYDGVIEGVVSDPPPARPVLQGFQKPRDTGKRVKVGMALVSYTNTGAQCSCGKPFKARRSKVLEDRIDEHLATKHDGKGFRL